MKRTQTNKDTGQINGQSIQQPTPLEELILRSLDCSELYGLQIVQAIDDASAGRRKIPIGSLYPSLHNLEKKGFIESRWGDEEREDRGGARRRYYRLTALGQQVLGEIVQFHDNLLRWQPS